MVNLPSATFAHPKTTLRLGSEDFQPIPAEMDPSESGALLNDRGEVIGHSEDRVFYNNLVS